jgi:hypothetical protein
VGIFTGFWIKSDDRLRWALVFSAAMASHGLLDALVSVKSGVELFSPFSTYRVAAALWEYPDSLSFSYYSSKDLLVVRGIAELFLVSALELFLCLPVFSLALFLKGKSK